MPREHCSRALRLLTDFLPSEPASPSRGWRSLLAGRAIEELTSGIRVTGVARRFVDEVDEHPAEVGAMSPVARGGER